MTLTSMLNGPVPGEEYFGTTLKAKVVSVTATVDGITHVEYSVGYVNGEYVGKPVTATIQRFLQFIGDAKKMDGSQ